MLEQVSKEASNAAKADRRNDASKPPFDLRTALDWLRTQGDLIETSKEVDPDLEVIGLQKHMDGGCPILFDKVKGKPNHRVVTNLFGDMNVINKMFGWKSDAERVKQLADALSHPLKPEIIPQSEAPVQQHIVENPTNVNDYMVPIRHTIYEKELTVGSGIRCISPAQFDGGTDLGYNRMNFRWGNVGTFQVSPGSHMWQVTNKYYSADQPIPLSMCFGVPPACTLLAGAGFDYTVLPMGCDEIGIAGAVQGSPIRLVKCRTVDAYTLADAELVLEGYVHPRDRRYETKEAEDAGVQGRFPFHPEWAGYMGKAYKAPTFHVTAVTMRDPDSRPIIFALGVHMLDDHNIDTTVREAALYELCQRLQPGIVQTVVIPVQHDRLGRLHHPGQEAPQDRRGLAAQFLGRRAVVLAGYATRHRGQRRRRPLFDGRHHVVPHHAGEPARRYPQSDPGRPRADLHARRTHDRGRKAVDRIEYAVRGRHGHRCHRAVWLRDGLPASGLSNRQGEA